MWLSSAKPDNAQQSSAVNIITLFILINLKLRCKSRPNAAYQTKKVQDKNKTFSVLNLNH